MKTKLTRDAREHQPDPEIFGRVYFKDRHGVVSEYYVSEVQRRAIEKIIGPGGRPPTDEDLATFGLERAEDGQIRRAG